jgi:hypothetical protein
MLWEETNMSYRAVIGMWAFAIGLNLAASTAFAFDESKYPEWRGQWQKVGGVQWDPSKKIGRDEAPPLKPQYQALFEASLADQASGGQGNDPTFTCIPPGMPRAMTVVFPMDIIILPEATYIIIEYSNQVRRIYTDGRDWPKDLDPTFAGYSIGKWIDSTGSGRYDVLEVETRDLKGPRVYDSTGLPFHEDNQTVINERIYLDKADRNLLHDDITVRDHALTRPFSANKKYNRAPEAQPVWLESQCPDGNHHVLIGKENYYVSEDGFLMPVKKNQTPPDLRYFKQGK